MIRRIAMLVGAALLATAGCRYCASPYDYCGPMFTGRDCTPCAPDSRAGSIYSDQVIPVPSYGAEVMEYSSDELRPIPDQLASGPIEGPVPGVDDAAAPRLFESPSNQPHRLTGYSQPAPWLPQR